MSEVETQRTGTVPNDEPSEPERRNRTARTKARASEVQAMLVDVHGLAKVLSCGVRSIWRRLAARELPEPVKIGRSVRWDLSTIREWIAQGCPKQNSNGKQRGEVEHG